MQTVKIERKNTKKKKKTDAEATTVLDRPTNVP